MMNWTYLLNLSQQKQHSQSLRGGSCSSFTRLRLGSQYVPLPRRTVCMAAKIEMDSIFAARHGMTGQCDIL